VLNNTEPEQTIYSKIMKRMKNETKPKNNDKLSATATCPQIDGDGADGAGLYFSSIIFLE